MPRQVKTSEDELLALCDEIQSIDGKVTAARLREAAGGGSHSRLKAVVETWQARRDESAQQDENSVQETGGLDKGQNGKPRAKARRSARAAKASAGADAPRRRGKAAATEPSTLEDVEQTAIAAEATQAEAALSGGDAPQAEMPTDPSSIEQAEAEVADALDEVAVQDDNGAAGSGTEARSTMESGAELSEETADMPAPPKQTSPGSPLPVAGSDAEIARLQAHVEDLRRENAMLWDQVRHEREARIREIELLNGMIQGMRR